MTSDPARGREQWPVRVYRLGSEPSDDLSATTTPEQRFEMVATLSKRLWELTGQPVPSYPRSQIPIRVIHRT